MKNTVKLFSVLLFSALLMVGCNKDNAESNENYTDEAQTIIYSGIEDTDAPLQNWFSASKVGMGYFSVLDEDFSMGIVNEKGELVLPCEYITVRDFKDGVVAIRGEDGWGYYSIDSEKMILEPLYDEVLDFSEGVGCYFDGEFYRYIDTEGKSLFDKKILEGAKFSDGLARVMTDDSLGYIGKDGEIAIFCDYEYFDDFREGYARVAHGEDFGFINKKGDLVIGTACDRIYNYSEGLAQFVADGKIGYLGKDGKVAFKTEYDALSNKMGDEYFRFIDGVAPFMKDGKYGFVNKEGETIIEPIYSMVMYSSEGIIRVRDENKLYGYVRVDGEVLTDCIFESATEFSGGTALVSTDGLYYFINRKGEKISDEAYLDATEFSGDFAMVYKDTRNGWSVVRKSA